MISENRVGDVIILLLAMFVILVYVNESKKKNILVAKPAVTSEIKSNKTIDVIVLKLNGLDFLELKDCELKEKVICDTRGKSYRRKPKT